MPVLTKINTNSIADDAITAEKYSLEASGYVAKTTNQNISGTYSDNRMYTSYAYTLSENATVNGNLTLSTVKSTGDVVLTAGGAYTITGTGVLAGGSLLAKANTDLTGMTGELGSAVTGSPSLNLGSATFPEGHFYKYHHTIITSAAPWGGSSAIAAPQGKILTAIVPDGHTAYSHAHGGVTRSDYPANACIAYEVDGSDPDASSSYYKGQKPGNSQFGNVMGVYHNNTGSDVTLKIQITAYGAGNWATAPDRPVYMSITIIQGILGIVG